jgi:hypothetical protein
MATTLPEIPKLSLPGNALVLAVNIVIARWAWNRGGAWKALAALNAFSAMYTISQIAKQL